MKLDASHTKPSMTTSEQKQNIETKQNNSSSLQLISL